jgi:hypothetical protein
LRSIRRQRTTPSRSGSGPASTRAASSAFCSGVRRRDRRPGDGRFVRPASPADRRPRSPLDRHLRTQIVPRAAEPARHHYAQAQCTANPPRPHPFGAPGAQLGLDGRNAFRLTVTCWVLDGLAGQKSQGRDRRAAHARWRPHDLSLPEPRATRQRPVLTAAAFGPKGRSRATWRSGYAADCKSVYTGSIPVVASSTPLRVRLKTSYRPSLGLRARTGREGCGWPRPTLPPATPDAPSPASRFRGPSSKAEPRFF